MVVCKSPGRSPHTFRAYDRRGKRHLVWFLDYEAVNELLRDGPRIMVIEDWQFHGRGPDLTAVALTTGISQ